MNHEVLKNQLWSDVKSFGLPLVVMLLGAFGWLTGVLGLVIVQLVLTAVMLATTARSRLARRRRRPHSRTLTGASPNPRA
jgi:hypothetical protein